MPVQPSNPLPALGTLMDQLDERAKDIEAKRVFYGCAVAPTFAFQPPGGTATIPGAYLNIFTGATGLCVLFAECSPDFGTGGAVSLLVSVNGGALTICSGSSNSVADIHGGVLVKGSAGFVLTPYTYNTFQLSVSATISQVQNVYSPTISVLPI